MSSLPVRSSRKYLRAHAVLRTVIEAQGPELFTTVLREKTAGDSLPEIKPLEWKKLLAVVREVRAQSWSETTQAAVTKARGASETLLRGARALPGRMDQELQKAKDDLSILPTLPLKAQYLGLRLLRPASWFGGFLLGIQLPALDIRFKRGLKSLDSITLHSVPLIGVEVTLEWIRRVLAMANTAPDLHPADRKLMQGLEQAIAELEAGTLRGAGARGVLRATRKLQPLQRSVALTAQSFQMIEAVLRELSSTERRKRS